MDSSSWEQAAIDEGYVCCGALLFLYIKARSPARLGVRLEGWRSRRGSVVTANSSLTVALQKTWMRK